MSAVDMGTYEEYTPSISRRINLSDTVMRAASDDGSVEKKPHRVPRVRVCHCLPKKDCCCARDASFIPTLMRAGLPPGSYTVRERPKLVSVDVFRESLLGMARAITSKEVGVDTSPERRMNTFPLIEAFCRVVDRPAEPIIEEPAVPPFPLHNDPPPVLPSVSTPIPLITSIPVSPVHAVVLPILSQIKLIRILEKISARRILRVWRSFWKRKRRDDLRLELKIKSMLKTAIESSYVARDTDSSVMSASLEVLANSRCIREELETLPKEEGVYKSVRVLLADTVQSPAKMDKLLANYALRLCVAQPTLHPKALVLVVASTMSLHEWKEAIGTNKYFSAIDKNFPLTQNTVPGLSWEVRVRTDMAIIVPDWRH